MLDDCLILDSTSSTKFSKHVIYIIKRNGKEYLFKNNTIIKEYITTFEGLLMNFLAKENYRLVERQKKILLSQDENKCIAGGTSTGNTSNAAQEKKFLEKFSFRLCQKFLINLNEKKEKGLFIDNKIYTRNRQFRTIFSTKFKKNSNLFLCPLSPIKFTNQKLSKHDFLKLTFVTLGSTNGATLFDAFPRDEMIFGDQVSLVTPNIANEKKITIINKSKSIYRNNSKSTETFVRNVVRSLIEKFCIINNINLDNVGQIREIRFEGDEIAFCDLYCNFCLCVNRRHRNNKVYFVVNFRYGSIYQKCYKCKNYSSPKIYLREFKGKRIILPKSVVPNEKFYNDDDTSNMESIFLFDNDFAYPFR